MSYYNGQLWVAIYLRSEEVLSAPRVLLVLKRSFTVSLSSLDVLFVSGGCVVLFLFGLFWRVFVLVEDILSFAFSPVLQQLEISWPTMPRARSALAPENFLQLITLVMAASSDFCTLVLHSEIWVCLYRGSMSALCNSTWLNRFIQVWFGLAAYWLSGLFTLRHHPKLTCNIGLCIFTDVVFPNGDHYSFMVLPAWW